MIAVEQLSFAYAGSREAALSEISFEIPDGQFVGVVGANGAGKSSLCYAVAGLIPHFYPGTYRGSVRVDGRLAGETALSQLSQHIGLVLQNPRNQISGARVTVAEEVAFGLENLGLERAEMHSRVDEALEQVGIHRLAERSPQALSGGEQQKVAIAAILAMRPKVLVLDEPTAQLDPASSVEIFRLLQRLSAAGVTVLLAEHRVDELADYAVRGIVLSNGRVVLDGAPEEVFVSPLLEVHGVASPHVTDLARQARAEGLWPVGRSLPSKFNEALAGFREIGDGA
jgi:energy-coupling factor transport system ATP-binding protein